MTNPNAELMHDLFLRLRPDDGHELFVLFWIGFYGTTVRWPLSEPCPHCGATDELHRAVRALAVRGLGDLYVPPADP